MFTTNKPIIDHEIPETLPEAQSMIRELLRLNQSSNEYSAQLSAQMKSLTEKFKSDINKLNQLHFGKKSEVASRLFDEAELTTVIESSIEDALNIPFLDADSDASDLENTDASATNTARNWKKKAKRKVLPDHLKRETIEHDLAIADKVCKSDGTALVKIGEDVREELAFCPAKFWVRRHVTPKYGCPKCHDGVICLHSQPRLLPGTVASPGVLAHLVISKYVDHLPLYRQEQIFVRHQLQITRATMAQWMIKVGVSLNPIVNLIRDEILDGAAIQCDETPVQVLKHDGVQVSKKCYMWVMGRAGPGPKAILYEYGRGRGGDVATRLLGDYRGFLQVDGYKGYDQLYCSVAGKRLGCMAHVRRKFVDVLKTIAKPHRDKHPAAPIVKLIGQLYAVEAEVREANSCFDAATRAAARQAKSVPLFKQLEEMIAIEGLATSSASPYGNALSYANHELPRIKLYLTHGECEIDNNGIENAIRPFALGRKNWMLSDTEAGAESSAAIYTALQTAKANGLNVSTYFESLLEKLPACKSLDDYVKLLPWVWAQPH